MINENRLIELLEEEILRIDTESTPGCGNLYGRDASVMKNTLNFVIDLINEQPKVGEWIPAKVGEWIPVEERLPNDRQVVLTIKNKRISILEYHADTKHWFETKGNWWWSFNMVDAWKPLPKPYKKEV